MNTVWQEILNLAGLPQTALTLHRRYIFCSNWYSSYRHTYMQAEKIWWILIWLLKGMHTVKPPNFLAIHF